MDLNVVDLILTDHRELKHLFEQVRTRPESRPAFVPLIVTLLAVHSRAEEAEVYPAAAQAGIEAVRHSQKEHLEADQLAAAVAAADPTSADFNEKLTALVDGVLHHIEEEESDVLPRMRELIGADELERLGRAFVRVREDHLGATPEDITAREMQQQARNAGISPGDQDKEELARTLRAAAEE